jgi:hypothetical protein
MNPSNLSKIVEYEKFKAETWPKDVMGAVNGFTYRKIQMAVIRYFPHSNRMGFRKETPPSGLDITRIIQSAH